MTAPVSGILLMDVYGNLSGQCRISRTAVLPCSGAVNMNINRVKFAGFSLEFPKGWLDVTENSEEGCLFTLSKENDAYGALQFAVRFNESEKSSKLDMDKLTSLLNVFSAKNELGTAGNVKMCAEDILSISGEFVDSDEFVCIWYATDNNNLAMFTYVSTLTDDPLLPRKVAEADQIVKSIIFDNKF
jgi:hypothetical protein